jgi:flagellar hook-associated protein 2
MTSSSSNVNLSDLTYVWDQILPGFNVQGLINNALNEYNQPVTQLENDESNLSGLVSDWQTINSDITSVQTAASALTYGQAAPMQATSSDASTATATAAPGAQAGTVSFVVDATATANSVISAGGVSSTAQVVTSASDLLLSQAAGIGFSGLTSNALTLGSHSVQVVQASQAASTTGTANLESSGATIATGTNDTVDLTVNGTPTALTIAGGTYTGAQLLTAVQSAITTAGLGSTVSAGYNSSGQLILSTSAQGSTQTLQVTGGDGLAALGLSAMASASQGSDAVVNVDGTNTDLATVSAGSSYTLNSGTGGSITATVGSIGTGDAVNSSLLSTGTVTATDISTGGGALSTIVNNINAANAGFTASAIDTENGYQLELTANSTGTASDITVDPTAFSGSGLGDLLTATAGSNASVSIGGVGGPTVTSATNSVQGLLPGVTVNLVQASSSPVTISVSPDTTTADSEVSSLVSSVNQLLSDIQKYGGYNAASETGGALMGNAQLQSLQQNILSTVAGNLATSSIGGLEAAGITLTSNGSYTNLAFNQATFNAAYAANPSEVMALFGQGGTFSPSLPQYTGTVQLGNVSNQTVSGSYAIAVSQSATQATDTGTVLAGGTVSAAETLNFSSGSVQTQYTTYAGQSLADIASNLNKSFSGAGLSLTASVVGGNQLEVQSQTQGSAASFTVTTTNGGAGTTGLAGTFTGTDVAGTVNGQAATGSGETLTAPGTSPFYGMSFAVSAEGISSTTTIGSFDYQPGLAASLGILASNASTPDTGWIATTVSGLQSQSSADAKQVTQYQAEATAAQNALAEQYSQLAGTLSSLQNQKSYLTDTFTSMGLL